MKNCEHIWLDAPNGTVYCRDCGKEARLRKEILYRRVQAWEGYAYEPVTALVYEE